MRCLSCDCLLSDKEATRKGTHTGEYLDLCDDCLSTTDIEYFDIHDDSEPVENYEELE